MLRGLNEAKLAARQKLASVAKRNERECAKLQTRLSPISQFPLIFIDEKINTIFRNIYLSHVKCRTKVPCAFFENSRT